MRRENQRFRRGEIFISLLYRNKKIKYKSVHASPTRFFMFRCTAGNIVVIRFQKSVTPPRQAVRNIACNIFQFMLPHHTKPPTASWSKSCCRILRALTLSASKTVSAPPSQTWEGYRYPLFHQRTGRKQSYLVR